MTKPTTTDELYLRRKFKHEDEIEYETEREARIAKRIWKKQTSKLHRKQGKQQIMKGLTEDET